MTTSRLIATALALGLAAAAWAADITGTWTSKFDSQVGEQNYTFTFKVNGAQLTGKAASSLSGMTTDITEGKVQGDAVSFVENLNFQGMTLKITYTGKIVSDNEIRFSRNVADFATEEIVAKRAN
jgi:opacity protein-like surface antigen